MSNLERDSSDPRYSRKKPCQECPFSRAVEPGTVGGSDPTTYVGQLCGPFLLCCHMDPGYSQTPGDQPGVAHCAGAAIMRANMGLAFLMPPALHALPPNPELVFDKFEELVAHHLQVPIEEAKEILEDRPPEKLLRIELSKIKPHMFIQGSDEEG